MQIYFSHRRGTSLDVATKAQIFLASTLLTSLKADLSTLTAFVAPSVAQTDSEKHRGYRSCIDLLLILQQPGAQCLLLPILLTPDDERYLGPRRQVKRADHWSNAPVGTGTRRPTHKAQVLQVARSFAAQHNLASPTIVPILASMAKTDQDYADADDGQWSSLLPVRIRDPNGGTQDATILNPLYLQGSYLKNPTVWLRNILALYQVPDQGSPTGIAELIAALSYGLVPQNPSQMARLLPGAQPPPDPPTAPADIQRIFATLYPDLDDLARLLHPADRRFRYPTLCDPDRPYPDPAILDPETALADFGTRLPFETIRRHYRSCASAWLKRQIQSADYIKPESLLEIGRDTATYVRELHPGTERRLQGEYALNFIAERLRLKGCTERIRCQGRRLDLLRQGNLLMGIRLKDIFPNYRLAMVRLIHMAHRMGTSGAIDLLEQDLKQPSPYSGRYGLMRHTDSPKLRDVLGELTRQLRLSEGAR